MPEVDASDAAFRLVITTLVTTDTVKSPPLAARSSRPISSAARGCPTGASNETVPPVADRSNRGACVALAKSSDVTPVIVTRFASPTAMPAGKLTVEPLTRPSNSSPPACCPTAEASNSMPLLMISSAAPSMISRPPPVILTSSRNCTRPVARITRSPSTTTFSSKITSLAPVTVSDSIAVTLVTRASKPCALPDRSPRLERAIRIESPIR